MGDGLRRLARAPPVPVPARDLSEHFHKGRHIRPRQKVELVPAYFPRGAQVCPVQLAFLPFYLPFRGARLVPNRTKNTLAEI